VLGKIPRPILLEFKTFRRRGHEEASGTKYVPEDLMNFWKSKDPIDNFESFLIESDILSSSKIDEFRNEISNEIKYGLKLAFDEDEIKADLQTELGDVYKSYEFVKVDSVDESREMRFIDAISDGLEHAMKKHDDLVIMGQDIAEYGGVFKITDGFLEKFGKGRVRNTPICESGIIETAMGLSIAGVKSIVELQFADFISSGFNPVVNYLAKSYYRWGQEADIVLRMPCGAGVGAGPFHSQTNEAWFTKTPGLKVLYPAFPYDAKGLLISAIQDPNPILFFEHKALYRSQRQEVPVDYYSIPIGKAAMLKKGKDVTIITYGAGVHWALETLNNNHEISADLIDLRSIQPIDYESIMDSVKKTNRAIILQEDSLFGGIASDISSFLMENAFEFLDAPVKRVGSLNTPIPFADSLERQYLANLNFENSLKALIEF
jgi:2-oxoisovalerate dehydrogenase E1 component